MLGVLVGEHPENLTMSWTCREILKGRKKDIQVIGPVESVTQEVIDLSTTYWQRQNS